MFTPAEPIVRNGRPPTAHSVHSFLHQYTGSFKKPPLRRPQSVIGGGLGSLMPRNGSRLGETHTHTLFTSSWSHNVSPLALNRDLVQQISFLFAKSGCNWCQSDSAGHTNCATLCEKHMLKQKATVTASTHISGHSYVTFSHTISHLLRLLMKKESVWAACIPNPDTRFIHIIY